MSGFERALLADLSVFMTIVRRGSTTQAAIELGVSPSALSHRPRKLEAHLWIRAFLIDSVAQSGRRKRPPNWRRSLKPDSGRSATRWRH
ncbi:LysR family transcriptional regulator [Xanthobacter sp. VTT E-85241]|jgi:hypothetical protein|uniref:helix-turn-helix domain-containing protein n=1 Tax=Roseixanthobacter finlandensis TaxID=3119922 RepID=UPI002CA64E52|nr:LysR family transcriptional regulator [Xanthobacteraceae bacterium]